MNKETLWKTRFRSFQKEVMKYGKYIFNNHVMILLLVLVGGGGYYYQAWLQEMPEYFPVALVMAVVLGVVLASGSVITLLAPADIVFLSPLEEELKTYFQKAFWMSFVLQMYLVLLAYGVLLPMTQARGVEMLLIALFLFLLKLGNLQISWYCHHWQDRAVRFVLNGILVYGVIDRQWIVTIIAFVFFAGYFLYQKQQRKGRLLLWEYLIARQERRWALFYNFANLFVDIPHVGKKTKGRKWLDIFLTGKKDVYTYLFLRTFLRSGDYLGMYLRLLVIGSAVVAFIPNIYASLASAVLFVYLLAFQLKALGTHHDYTMWTSLYPVVEEKKQIAVRQLTFRLLFLGSVVLAIINLLTTWNFLFPIIILGSTFLLRKR